MKISISFIYISIFLIFSLLLSSCVTNKAIDNKNSSSINIQHLKSIAYFKSKYPQIINSEINSYFNKLTKKIVKNYSKRKCSLSFVNITILKSAEIFALTLNSSDIILSSKLILSLNNEAELAYILAHEVAHLVLCHPTIINHSNNEKSDISTAYQKNKSISNLQSLTKNKVLELEADALALKNIMALGYNPQASLSAISNLYFNVSRDDSSIYLNQSSHPLISERIEFLGKNIDVTNKKYLNENDSFFKTQSLIK